MGAYGLEAVKKLHQEVNEASQIYIKLEDDRDRVVVAFLGEPYGDEVCWNEKTQSNEPYTKEDKAAGRKKSAKYTWNVWCTHEGDDDDLTALKKPCVKILNLTQRTLTRVLKNAEKYGLDKKFFEVERKGKRNDQKTEYSVLPDAEISAEDQKLFASIIAGTHAEHKLHPLAKDEDGKRTRSNGASAQSNGSGKSDAHLAGIEDLKKRLKAIVVAGRRADADRFLVKFGIDKVVSLPEKDIEAAKAFVDELEGKTAAAPPAAAASEDPFA